MQGETKKTLVVLGGGAAGFFGAVNAARLSKQLRVIICEKSNKLLSKVKVSGGGRCNVTNACSEIPALVKHYPRGATFLKKGFHQFQTVDCRQWFQQRGVELKAEPDGRMFPVTDSSQTVISCLLNEAGKYGVDIRLNSEAKQVRLPSTGDSETGKFIVQMANGTKLETDFLLVACGGFSKTGMFEWLTSLGHSIQEPLPSLFTFNMPGNPVTQLMGVSAEAEVKIAGTKLSQQGPVLITHWGMSGPAILKLSAWGARELAKMNYRFKLVVNWLPAYNENSLRDEWQQLRNLHAAQKMYNKNSFGLPNRLWNYLLAESEVVEPTRWAELGAKAQNKLINKLCAQEYPVEGKTTYKEEFVTCGGISLHEIDAGTMESKLVPGLYFAGEIMDVDGVTGGFNFQHAWTSGWIAANSIAKILNADF